MFASAPIVGDVLGLKKAVRNFVRSHGYDFVRTPTLHSFLESRGVDLVVDVGANSGGYGEYLRRWGYKGAIHSLEPVSDTFERLGYARAHDPLWSAERLAAGSEPGTASINVSRGDSFSSFHSLSEAGTAYDPMAEVVRQEVVPIVTLDELMKDCQADAPFLKADTQGFEREVLEGAKSFLKRCVGVQLELPIQHLYNDVWCFEEAIAYMRRQGFMVAQIMPVNPRHDDWACMVEYDCVFCRA